MNGVCLCFTPTESTKCGALPPHMCDWRIGGHVFLARDSRFASVRHGCNPVVRGCARPVLLGILF